MKNLPMVIIVAIAVGVAGFFGGMKYQQTKSSVSMNTESSNNGGGRTGARFGARNGGTFRPTVGEIIASDEGERLLAGYLLRQSADRINCKASDSLAQVQLHYDH